VSAPVVFTVTVLKPLTIRIQPPLHGDDNSINNIVKLGSTVPTKVRLFACGTDVTKTASVVVKIDTTLMPSGGSSKAETVAVCNDAPDSGGVMILDGSHYRYNLSTKGLAPTAGVPAFYQESITAAYKSRRTSSSARTR
jgi:type 1 fimbria pilin